MASQWNDKRPMAPHLQIWRWHPAMLSSILHRASAIICYIGLIKVAIGLLVLTLTGKLPLEGLIFSPLGAIGLFVFLFAFIFMALAQLRHAIWDKGAMMDPDKNNMLSYIMIAASVILAVLITVFAAGAA
ncbi:succinate dehydrogenase, cytochrome b556 subunit [Hellea balneolensis]|uniref:succinate dehydrogenase, cytochrome b556 subunit n=1 Tax=Hellea balneolensis TaxID=287478 RepID=UPI0004792DFA|nr:succinate dehydrogenase, cytochrome b556 subunit [Hellea balneolensis]